MKPEDLSELYRTYRASAWRLECFDTYAVPGEDEDFDAWLEDPATVPARTAENSSWLANIAQQRHAGKFFGRVRIFSYPLTPYTEFEFAGYKESLAVGEDIQLIDRASLAPSDQAWAHQDFWLFDDAIAVLQHYDGQGRYLGAEQAADAAPYAAIRRRAEALAVPFESVLARVPGPREHADGPTGQSATRLTVGRGMAG